jgi:hypothetical protein
MNRLTRLIFYGVVIGIMLISLYQIYILKPVKVELGINESLVLAFASIAIYVIGSILHTLNTLKKSMPAIIGGAVVLGIYLVGYLVAEPVPMAKFPNVSETLNKLIGGGLITVYVLGVAAIVIAVYSEVVALIKS